MKIKSCEWLVFVSFFFFLATARPAQALEFLGEEFPSDEVDAVVVEVGAAHVVGIEVSRTDFLHPGDRVEIMYQADLMPMILGVYEVVTVQGKRITARPLTLTSEPMRGMQVRVARKGDGQDRPSDAASVKTHEDHVYGHGDEASQAGLIFNDTPAPEILTGIVDEVRGQEIVVALPQGEGVHARPGQTVEAFLVLSSGKELGAGKWKVSAVEGDRTICAPDGPVRPRKGLKAVIRTVGPASSLPPDLEGAARFLETFDRSGSLFDPDMKVAP
ncbi:MAG: hypothetical protein CVU60_12585 [Deltaproteobacteria bacterium HGW-Deltaproteobacteria-18]|jgi:hypothetical protein|nr:MAG: hypothetical protein CVU60_12585 [Deltaproteobacteria bacterium HGW-Deltaproteobacteria-18]